MPEKYQENGVIRHLRPIIRWGLYPFSWAVVLTGFYLIQQTQLEARTIWGVCIGMLAGVYFLTEFFVPYERRWAMTFKSFLNDLKYVLVNSLAVGGLTTLLAFITITVSGELTGPAHDWPIWLQVPAALLIFEALNYTMHRYMHEGRGRFGEIMWRAHAAHHLPERLYLVMHAVFHPINGVIIQGLTIILPVWLMGYSQDAVVMFFMINGMHGLISHFNVDLRMGFMNYLFIGPELHRYHHSAKVKEAGNFGNTLSIYDQLFGSFVYHPGVPPKELGVDKASGFPAYGRLFKVLALPFGRPN